MESDQDTQTPAQSETPTPAAETPSPAPEPARVSEPPRERENGNERLDRLEDILDSLVNVVSKLIPADEQTVERRKPWTHRGGK